MINGKHTYRIPPRVLCNIGLVNHPIKLDTKIFSTLQPDLAKLLESNLNIANIAHQTQKQYGMTRHLYETNNLG